MPTAPLAHGGEIVPAPASDDTVVTESNWEAELRPVTTVGDVHSVLEAVMVTGPPLSAT